VKHPKRHGGQPHAAEHADRAQRDLKNRTIRFFHSVLIRKPESDAGRPRHEIQKKGCEPTVAEELPFHP
jgi:hypothetical protein